MSKTVAARIAISIFVPGILIVSTTRAPQVEARSKPPISISFETRRFDPEKGCRKDVDGCLPKVWIPTREFDRDSKVWVKASATNHSNRMACTAGRNYTVEVIENVTGKNPDLVPAKDGMLMITAAPPEINVCIPPRKTNDSLLFEITGKYVLANPGTYRATFVAPGFGLTSPQNIGYDDPMHQNYYRDAKAVQYLGNVESGSGEFVIRQ